METLVVGDGFIAAHLYADALAERCGPAFGPVRAVDWAGAKATQHELQQVMEKEGPNAVPVP